MTDPRPLWEVMEESTGTVAEWGDMIRAVRDWLVPEERTLDPVWFGTAVEHESNWRQGLRALLTAEADRAQRQPVPPEPGEVQELVKWLMDLGAKRGGCFDVSTFCANLTRAADLLAQRYPQPVPVSERLPGPEDCLEIKNQSWTMHYCWLGYSILHDGKERAIWDWRAIPMGSERGWEKFTHWLPASTRFLPGEVEG